MLSLIIQGGWVGGGLWRSCIWRLRRQLVKLPNQIPQTNFTIQSLRHLRLPHDNFDAMIMTMMSGIDHPVIFLINNFLTQHLPKLKLPLERGLQF